MLKKVLSVLSAVPMSDPFLLETLANIGRYLDTGVQQFYSTYAYFIKLNKPYKKIKKTVMVDTNFFIGVKLTRQVQAKIESNLLHRL